MASSASSRAPRKTTQDGLQAKSVVHGTAADDAVAMRSTQRTTQDGFRATGTSRKTTQDGFRATGMSLTTTQDGFRATGMGSGIVQGALGVMGRRASPNLAGTILASDKSLHSIGLNAGVAQPPALGVPTGVSSVS